MCRSPRTRSPADWFTTSWEIFIPLAQHARAVPPSVTRRASLLRTGSSTALMASALSPGRTALTTAPLRSAATRIGTCSCDRPRFVALPPRPRAARSGSGPTLFRAFPGPGGLIAEQHEVFVGLDNAGQDRTGHRGGEKAVAPAKGGADRHTARPRRLAFAQRPAEVEPALLLPQPGQRRAGQRVEAPAASLAPEPPQSVGLAAADRRPVAAVRAAPFVTRARLDHRRYRHARRLSGQHLFKLQALVDGQVVHLRKPRPKDAVFHHKLPQYATNSTMGSRTDLTPIEPMR